MRSTYVSILTNAVRHLWRKRAFWIIQAALSILPLLISMIIYLVDPDNPISMGASVPGTFTLALNYLVLPFLVAPAILEDFGKIGEILWSGPLDNLVYFAARFSGLWLGLAAGSLIQLTGWFLASLVWLNIVTDWVFLLSLAIYLMANTLGLCVVFLLAVLLRRTMPLMMSWAAIWVWLYYTVIFDAALAESFNPLTTIALSNIFFHNLNISPSLGLGLPAWQVVGMFAWFSALSLLALSLSLLLSPLVDPRRATRLGWVAPLFACAALLTAGAGFWINARTISAHGVPPSPSDVQIDVWQVLSQHTVVTVDAGSGRIDGEARFELSPTEAAALDRPVIVLRLNAGLALTAASDASGNPLTAERLGDSVIINLPSIPQSPFTLNLAWEGRLQIPYISFQQRWQWYDAPDNYGFAYMPQPLRGLIQPNGGFLLRDGDWMPWPWSTLPHQALENHLEIRPQGAAAAAAIPLVNGAANLEGSLPEGLLVFLPGKQVAAAGGIILAMSPLVGRQHREQARLFSAAASTLADLFDTPPPRYAIVVPYLSKLIWSGDLLLVPDESGYYVELPNFWLYDHDVSGQYRKAISRATMHALARAYFLDQVAPQPLIIKALLYREGQTPEVVAAGSFTEQEWLAGRGRWAQAPESFDFATSWDYRRRLILKPQGEWSTVAFWLAMELADEETRQADLDGIAFFDSTHSNDDYSERYALMRKQVWPEVLDTNRSRAIVLQLHNLTLRIGTSETLTMLSAILQETHPETVTQLLAELEQRSQNLTNEVQP
jgi:hypothetical protein